MSNLVHFRIIYCLAALSSLASCTGENNPETFQGEPLIAGPDSDAVFLTIDDPEYPAVALTHGEGAVGIGVFQAGTGAPVLTIHDDDNDGVFDLLTYSALSESGQTLVEVEDYGMDGQPDLIVNHEDSTATVFVDGSWHEVEGVGTDSVTVLLDGEQIPLSEIVSDIRERTIRGF